MRMFISSLRAVLVFLIAGCAIICCKAPMHTNEVMLKNGGRDELNLQATGYGRDEKAAMLDAFKRAVDAVLYRGFTDSGSPVKDPLIRDKDQAMSQHKDFFHKLYEERMLNEVILSYNQKELNRIKNDRPDKWEATYDVKVNLRLLRSRLEDAGIIRKFGI